MPGNSLFIGYCVSVLCIVLTTALGLFKFRYFDTAMKTIVILLVTTSISEVCAYVAASYEKYQMRYMIYHLFSIVQGLLITTFFINALKPVHQKRLLLFSAIFWPGIGIANIEYLQPLTELNSNMLLVESFCFITLSLYFIYDTLKKDYTVNILYHPHSRIAVLLLILWSSSFFFWAFVKLLYRGQWEFIRIAMHVQIIVNIVVYTGIGYTMFIATNKMKPI